MLIIKIELNTGYPEILNNRVNNGYICSINWVCKNYVIKQREVIYE